MRATFPLSKLVTNTSWVAEGKKARTMVKIGHFVVLDTRCSANIYLDREMTIKHI